MAVIKAPLTEIDLRKLHTGEEVLIDGVVFTARDAAHRRLAETIAEGKELPLALEGQIIYYCGPAPARPGRVIGSAGPTTSSRMDQLTGPLLDVGVKVFIGKGRRSEQIKALMLSRSAVYLAAVGGAGAVLSRHITAAEIVAYPDLGPEAIFRLHVKSFPTIVCYDCWGGDLYDQEQKKFRRD